MRISLVNISQPLWTLQRLERRKNTVKKKGKVSQMVKPRKKRKSAKKATHDPAGKEDDDDGRMSDGS